MAITATTENKTARITIDAPDRRNALSPALIQDLTDALETAAQNEDVRSVILDHTGSTFCSGADLAAVGDTPPEQVTANFIGLLRTVVELSKPVIAVVDGNVRAGGTGLVASCDMVFASPGSSFATTETRIGVAPAMIALTVLPRLSSRAASRYLLSGERFDAATAERQGLVTEVVDDPRAQAAALADGLLKCSPQGLRETKMIINQHVIDGFNAGADALAAKSAELFASEEALEGITSFLQKRAPSWAQ
ncbi:Enoyl-CoA hydratase [Corynebacterium glyciniphilum AJ 3170]|uniref:Enoyl-CoA hydratase n=1 Tax=Corynebacterium glyciniphilum AJ 3170 TaxID=1404245 RepID=X5DP45_9CORY|nr:enoyl-CoA hydratase family protein [Corynebacterium glyciniphilum]AHW63069.1 Enoyl-CoA hydratase [Corynebacterium glyciniphilum AJ 3170]